VFTARYALSPYIKEIRFVFKGLIINVVKTGTIFSDFWRSYSCVAKNGYSGSFQCVWDCDYVICLF
jgi:hypothetical protein